MSKAESKADSGDAGSKGDAMRIKPCRGGGMRKGLIGDVGGWWCEDENGLGVLGDQYERVAMAAMMEGEEVVVGKGIVARRGVACRGVPQDGGCIVRGEERGQRISIVRVRLKVMNENLCWSA
jgi:hypothetical protein